MRLVFLLRTHFFTHQLTNKNYHANKKKKKAPYDPIEICQELYETIRNYKTEDGRLLCEAFIRAPKRRTAADYYDVVSTPIDLLKIQQKLKTDEYEELEQFAADIELMVNNTKAYYRKNSQEYKDACDLWEIFQTTRNELLSEAFGDPSPAPSLPPVTAVSGTTTMTTTTSSCTMVAAAAAASVTVAATAASVTTVATTTTPTTPVPERRRSARKNPNDGGQIQEEEEEEMKVEPPETPTHTGPLSSEDVMEINQLYTAIISAKDGERDISEVFQRLPPRSKYPKYYEIIKDPIDLKLIGQRIQDGYYSNVAALEKDLLLMIKNAKTFNEPRSQVYRDAVTLRKIIASRKHDSDARKAVKSSARIRELQNIQKTCVKEQSEDESDLGGWQSQVNQCEEESYGSQKDRSFWSLYFSVKNYKNAMGQNLAEPFYKLPSQRQYPDYYEEIKMPMALFNVRKKIKKQKYETLDELAADLNLIFDNAKHYNTDESSLYKDACRLQKIMMDKKKELEKFEVKPTCCSLCQTNTQATCCPATNCRSATLRPHQSTVAGLHSCRDVAASSAMTNSCCAGEHLQAVKMDRDAWEDDQTPRSLKSRKSLPSSTELEKKKLLRRSNVAGENVLTKRLWMLYKSVFDFCDSNGRYLREIFMTLPLKRDYPDYYRVIMEPIDMTTIENKIKCEKYVSELKLISDFELMFSNARHYNEEDSQVYLDADTLERVLKNKWKSMMSHPETAKKPPSKSKSRSKCVSPLCMKLQDLFDTIKDHADSRGRMLSAPFLKLPLKSEYPDYYEVIKRPIDMQRIQQRVASNQYESIDDMVADFVQMFDNACKYNEPDSLIYKDALTLQRVCLEKKLELSLDGVNEVPDVQAIVQELMTNLFISVYNYQDEEGRCYSDSFAELPERNPEEELEAGVDKEKPLTFDQIKRNLNKGCYARVDRFQEDMFKVFERARQLSRIDSQLYEDAVEMQLFFIKIRDELCKNGEILLTPALSYTEKHLQSALEAEKREKLPKEQQDDEKKKAQDTDEKMSSVVEAGTERSMKYRDQVYNIGDFVYVEPREKGLEAHVMCIEKLFHDNTGSPALHGNWFYRPNETFHLATRKFLEKEVFKSDFSTTIPLSQVMGPKCYVMFVKDYFKMKPEGFADKDVYVCESRYNARHKAFKKIKVWQVPPNDTVKLTPRDQVLSPVRVASVFADKTKENEKEDLDDGVYRLLDKTRENVEVEVSSQEYAGNKYYEQYNSASGCFKLGDCVYIKSTEEKPFIARIDKIWLTAEGNTFFYGPLFVRPSDVEHSPTRMFYCREVFYSCKETSFPAMTVIGRCAVLHIKDYCSYRITEVPEDDVYICESKYLENERSIRKLAKGLKKYSLSPKVTDDELYFFKKHIVPQKEPSPLLPEAVDMEDIEDEEKMDYPLVTTPNKNLNVSYEETPLPEKSGKKDGTTGSRKTNPKSANNIRRQPSGYIVFAGEIRKQIQQENPDCSFGDISRIVGTKWRNLSKEEKERFEEKAKKIAEEQAAKQEAAEKAFNDSLNNPQSPWSDYSRSMSPAAGPPGTNGQPLPGNFQNQFGFQAYPGVPHHPGLAGSGTMQQRGVPSMSLAPGLSNNVSGMSGVPPSGVQQQQQQPPQPPQTQQVQQQQQQQQRSPYMSPYHQHPPPPHHHQHHHHPGMRYPGTQPPPPPLPGAQHMAPPPQPRPPSPMFVSVPPRTQRLLHSEAYIRYIEGLSTSSKNVSDWNKSLIATPESTTAPNEKLLAEPFRLKHYNQLMLPSVVYLHHLQLLIVQPNPTCI
ncbi:PBRM1 [Acanthosepion pharaonis]|uniref:PBRM1 n=1 Tax=Acanthosepion pharaonis TaxID=158019 RepID=A0A812EHG1_ACAPH|nr:PBRM1 [Sepia pharaonis]